MVFCHAMLAFFMFLGIVMSSSYHKKQIEIKLSIIGLGSYQYLPTSSIATFITVPYFSLWSAYEFVDLQPAEVSDLD